MQYASWLRRVRGIHYAWVMLGLAIAIRLISSIERTASGVLLAYLVDHVNVHAAFAIAAAVSLALVLSYIRVVARSGRALLIVGAAQAVFLVLFSYAFFFEGFTGLTITIGAIGTLFLLMQLTARVSWDEVFAGRVPVRPVGGTDANRL